MTDRSAGRASLVWRFLAVCLCFSLLTGCGTLPSLANRDTSTALAEPEAHATTLGRALAPQLAEHPGQAGIYPLADAQAAFAARMRLAQSAERTLDVQYYIWHGDTTGTLLFNALRAAADRGVRVRLLLDDNNTQGLDTTLAALDAHPNIEVRLFNPFAQRSLRALGYLTDFARLNRRMHNKSFTVDNRITIVGGRNIGDEYFGVADGQQFADLDVAAVGPVVGEVSAAFDRYWASESAYPVARLLPPAPPSRLRELDALAAVSLQHPANAARVKALRDSTFIRELLGQRLPLEWAPARLLTDDPAKGLGKAAPAGLLANQLEGAIGQPEQYMSLVSPYFVPTADGVEAFGDLRRRGVKVRVLTNSLSATDVAIVHAGYAKRRRAMLESGITLYEMRRNPLSPHPEHMRIDNIGRFGSSGSSLHAKTFTVDRSRVFIGSFNFDPRSARLNTELGLVIDSPPLAQQIATAFREPIPANAYEVRLDEHGDLYWVEQRDGQVLRYYSEPDTSFWLRAEVAFFSLLPIEGML
ncbi:MAG TPA: phospholipase D family protein [Pseudomonas sp.]|nr:phospholipase D family protein [Pseudomonas sp.]